MVGWSLLVWSLLAVVLTPLSTAILRWIWHRGDESVVGNEALVAWLFTGRGATWLLAAGSLALIGAALQYAGFFELITADLEDRRTSLTEIGLRLPRRLPSVLRLCAAVTAVAFVLALPLAAGLYGIRHWLLGAQDINYYLYERPSRWWVALAVAGGWALIWGAGAAYVAARSLLALPAYLDGHRPLRAALRSGWRCTRGRGARIARLLLGAAVAWIAVRTILGGAVVAGTSWLVDWTAASLGSLYPVVMATGGAVLLTFLVDAAVAFLGVAYVSTLLTKLYYEDTELHAAVAGDAGPFTSPGAVARRAGRWLRPGRVVGIAAVAIAGSAIAGGAVLQGMPDRPEVAVTAHRAGPPPSPENTLAALERSIEAEADWSEVDVQLTADGVPIVVHDADLMRMAGDRRRVSATDYSELKAVVQRPDDGTPPSERRVATLREFLDRARGRIGLNIELKYYGREPRLAEEVVRTVREADMAEDVMVMSLDLGGVGQVHRSAPEIETGYAAALAVGDLARLPVEFLAVARSRVSRRLLRAARRRGVEIHVWTLNRAPAMVEVVQQGVDGIITDRPALAVRVVREMEEMPPVARLLLRFGSLAIDEEETGDESAVPEGRSVPDPSTPPEGGNAEDP